MNMKQHGIDEDILRFCGFLNVREVDFEQNDKVEYRNSEFEKLVNLALQKF